MRQMILAVGLCLATASPALAQIDTAAADDEMKPFFDKANKCLSDFDAKARAKRLSVETYRLALEGACTQEIKDMRALYSLHNARNENQEYLVDRLDANVKDARSKLVSSYAMR